MASPIDKKPFSSEEATKEVSTRMNIPANFKSLPLVLQMNIVDNLKVRELEALKVSLGKAGNPELIDKINKVLAHSKVFPFLADFLNKEDVTQKIRGGRFSFQGLGVDMTSKIGGYLSVKELRKFCATSKHNNDFRGRFLTYAEAFKVRDYDRIVKNHPDWDADIVRSWKISTSEKLWLVSLYDLHQYFPILFLKSPNPEVNSVDVLTHRKQITEELNQIYEKLKLKFS